jgi:putative transposase
MRAEGTMGLAAQRRRPRTTIPGDESRRPRDLVERDFRAPAPNPLWVTDITYVELAGGGFCYTALVTDVFSRAIVGWQVLDTLKTELALAALEMLLWARKDMLSRAHWCTMVTGVFDTCPSATVNDLSTPELNVPSVAKAIPMITRWRNL